MLIIHPEDSTTKFLERLYLPYLKTTKNTDNALPNPMILNDAWRSNGKIIENRISRAEINKLICHEKSKEEFGSILLLGHGTAHGLLGIEWGMNVNRKGRPILVVGEREVDALRYRKSRADYEKQHRDFECSIIGIWCYANEFALNYGLRGLYSGMIISEIDEALNFGFNVGRDLISETNQAFCDRLSHLLNEYYLGLIDLGEIPDKMKSYIEEDGYKFGVGGYPIISFNYSNLYYY